MFKIYMSNFNNDNNLIIKYNVVLVSVSNTFQIYNKKKYLK